MISRVVGQAPQVGVLAVSLAIAAIVLAMAGPSAAQLPTQLPAQSSAQSSAPAPADSKWRPAGCPPLPETGTGQSNVKVTGPCGFDHKGDAECEAAGDDLLVTVVRKGRNDSELMLFVNVERYVGPGKYRAPNDLFVSLKEGSKIYRWYSNRFVATVGPESKSVTVTDVRLEPQLLLVGCTGPQTNYQCDGRGDEPRLMETFTTVTGTIACKPAVAKK
jgi:hypothetical protein